MRRILRCIAKTYDEVQAGIDADALFVAKLQQKEKEGDFIHLKREKQYGRLRTLSAEGKAFAENSSKRFYRSNWCNSKRFLEEHNSTKVEVLRRKDMKESIQDKDQEED
ncbi:hypothetical protein Tco_0990431 [Tanacetum coccineum]|uniref:Uncharacterized protein n=1 Tax=Tanacetum coccineum TaxID=301880 RepID=A0ABQ5EY33_9ASTR